MPIDTTVQYYVITDFGAVGDGDAEEPREDGDWRRVREKDGVKFGFCHLYDGAAPCKADSEAENLWELCNLESEYPEDITFMNLRHPTRAINRLAKGEISGTVVGQEWVIIPADDFSYDE